MFGLSWRALRLPALVAGTLVLGGCSLILDFSELADAGIDAAEAPCEAFEPNNTQAESTLLPGGGATAAICTADPADLDFFRFTSAGGVDTVITLSMEDGTANRNLNIRVYAEGGDTAIAETDTETNEDILQFTSAGANQLTAGNYEIEVFGLSPDNMNIYTLLVSQ